MIYVQPALFEPDAPWRPPALSSLPSWSGAKRVAIDIETNDKDLLTQGPGVRRGAYIVGVSFAIEGGPAHYLPFRHEGGDNLPAEAVLAYLRDQANAFRGDLCGANLNYDLDFLEEVGVYFIPRFHRDVQVAEPLLDEQQLSYSLENIAIRRGLPGKDESFLCLAARLHGLHPKGELWKLPARYVGPYATQDVLLPLALLRIQEKALGEQRLLPIYDLESRVLPILLKMRRRGVRIDLRRLDELEVWLIKEETEALERVRTLSGTSLSFEDVTNASALSPIITALGLAIPMTPKTKKPSIDKDFLKGIQAPVARALERARRLDKIRRDFVRSIREHLCGDRIHTTFHQLRATRDDGDSMGTITGRLSSADPNLQQQPARDEELGPMWRSIYVPDEGCLWASSDYSAQEPRMTVHYAALAGCRGAAEMVARYIENPKLDLHMATADLCYSQEADRKKARKDSKEIFLGLAYGMGGAKLCRKLGLPTTTAFSKRQKKNVEVAGPEGQILIDQYHTMVPFIKELSEKVQEVVARRGFLRTLAGRRCRFPIDKAKSDERHTEFQGLHKALNKLIQGSSADQTKTAMVALDQAGFQIQLQVHDEIDLSVRTREEGEAVARIMETCVVLRVPTVADLKVEANWGTCKG